ncbi:MAG: hypothetical protein HY698_01905, partial [Deltaproteobacteria bacterium]|nr:hypothetical protein [Deltaproteobacteria bacterium]
MQAKKILNPSICLALLATAACGHEDTQPPEVEVSEHARELLSGPTFAITQSATDTQTRTAVASDGNDYLLVFEATRDSSPDGLDIYGVFLNASGTPKAPEFAIATGPGNQARPSVVFNGTDYLVAWDHGNSNLTYSVATLSQVEGALIGKDGSIKKPRFTIMPGDSPAIAQGTSATLVVSLCQGHLGYCSVRLDSAGNVLDGTPLKLNSMASHSAGGLAAPAVAYNKNVGNYLVAFEVTPSGSWLRNDLELRARRLAEANTLIDTEDKIIKKRENPAYTYTSFGDPDAAFDGNNYVVVWRDIESTATPTESAIYYSRISADGALLDGRGVSLATGGKHRYDPAVAFDGTNYMVVWADKLGPTDYILGSRVSPTNGPIEPQAFLVGGKYGAVPEIHASPTQASLAAWQARPAADSTRWILQGAFVYSNAIVSNFDASGEGWRMLVLDKYIDGNINNPVILDAYTGGNCPFLGLVCQYGDRFLTQASIGDYLCPILCEANGSLEYIRRWISDEGALVAPPKFLGDLSKYFGRTLSWDLKFKPDAGGVKTATSWVVKLTGAGRRLAIDVDGPATSSTLWHRYNINLSRAGWWCEAGCTDGLSETEFMQVLSNVTDIRLWISHVYSGQCSGPCPYEQQRASVDIDNIILGVGPRPNPTTWIDSPATNSYITSTPAAVKAGVSDTDGLSYVRVQVKDANGALVATLIATRDAATGLYVANWNPASGTYTLTSKASFLSGTTEYSEPVTVTIDTTAPTTSITSPVAGAALKGPITIEASATDNTNGSGMAKVELYVEGYLVGVSTASPYRATFNPGIISRPLALQAKAYDKAGNVGTSTVVTVNADNIPPTGSITKPTSGQYVGKTVTFEATTSDDFVGVSGVEFFVDGASIGVGNLVNNVSTIAWDSVAAGKADGQHSVYCKPVDYAGNAGYSPTVLFNLDNTAPTISIGTPAPGAVLNGTATIGVNASGYSSIQYFANGAPIGTSVANYLNWDTTSLPNGTYTLTATAFDLAGNSTTSAGVSVSIIASYNATLKAPKCSVAGAYCDTGMTLIKGRGTVGPEPNYPNTINSSCADGSSGTFHVDESIDRLKVATTDGTPMGAGKTVKIEATVWAYSAYSTDTLDLYYAADANNPTWTFIGSLKPTARDAQVLSTTYTLPAGSLQAIRARFRYQGTVGSCGT